MKAPLVSVVIPCYNHQDFVLAAIQSVIDQNYNNIELIVIDDGSTDGSVEKINELIPVCVERFSRFEFRSRSNMGLCATLNEGIEWCEGIYYSAIASDDIMLPTKTSAHVNYLENNLSSVAVFGGVEFIDSTGEVVRRVSGRVAQYNFSKIFLHAHNLPAPAQTIRLSALNDSGRYREDLAIEDWYMWLMLSAGGGTLDCISEICVQYRRHPTNFSSNLLVMERERFKIVDLFKWHPLFERAKASAFLMAAIDMQPLSKIQSLSRCALALSFDLRLLIDFRFFKYAMKMLVPKFVLLKYFGMD